MIDTKKRKVIGKAEKILVIFVLLFIFLTMYYGDIVITLQHSLIFIDSLFDGKFASFYINTRDAVSDCAAAGYDIGIYLIFAIWALPVWIANKIWSISVVSIPVLLWFKLLLVIFLGAVIKEWNKISLELEIDDATREYVSWLGAISLLTVFPLLCVAQYDIIPIFFILKGIYYSILGRKKESTIFFSIAITMKPFALMVFVLLVLFEEKKICQVIIRLLKGLAPVMICKGIYLFNPDNIATNNSFLNEMLTLLVEVTIPAGNGNLSLFSFFTILIYLLSFLHEARQEKIFEWKIFLLYVFALWANFCVFIATYPYWVIYLAPFLMWAVCFSMYKADLALILDLIVNCGIIANLIIRVNWVFGGEKTFSYLLLKPLYEKYQETVHSVSWFVEKCWMERFNAGYNAFVLASLLGLIYLSYWGIKNHQKSETVISPIHIRIRIIILYLWCILCILLLNFPLGK